MAERHAHSGMAEQPREDGHRHTVYHRVARKRVTQVVKAAVRDVGFPPDPIPEREAGRARTCGGGGRREYEGTPGSRLPVENQPGLGVEGNRPRSCLTVAKMKFADRFERRRRSTGLCRPVDALRSLLCPRR